jgi:hypothetical protein
MMSPFNRYPLAAACGLLTAALSPPAWAAQLIANGGFEADKAVIQSPDPFTAWTAAEDGLVGGVAINAGNSTPASGRANVGAAAGVNYAVLDLAAPSRMSIAQQFTVGAAPVGSATLSFQWFATYGGTETAFITQPNGLDHTRRDSVLALRVDILREGASAFSTAADDLVFSGTFTAPLAGGPQPYLTFTQTFVGLAAGESYSLRFAAAANRGALGVGIDEVSLNVPSVPEPSSWALMAAGLALFGATARRRP